MLSSSLRRVGTGVGDVPASHVRHASSDFSKLMWRNKKTGYKVKEDSSDLRRIGQTAKHLINGARQSRNPEWRHTYDKKGEPGRLREDVSRSNNVGLQAESQKRNVFHGHPLERWTIEDLVRSSTTDLKPGTYFEIRRNANVIHGIVLGAAEDNFGYNEDTFSINTYGEGILHRSSDVMFTVPNFVDEYLIKRCGRDRLHKDEHELAARLKVLKLARDFERAVQTEQFRLGRLMNDIYPQVRAEAPDEWGRVTTMQVARMLDAVPNVPIVSLFAVHKQLMERSDEFTCHPIRHRFVHSFDVRPLSHLQNVRTVKEWIRTSSPIISGFQAKAKLLIEQSRKLARETSAEPPSRVESTLNIRFTPEEHEIMTLLKLSMAQGRRIQENTYEGIVPSIIKDTLKYDELITSSVTLRFLQEIGVYTPWEDLASKERELHLLDDTEQLAVSPVLKATKIAPAMTKVNDFLTVDSHESVRHDFGKLPVFVIDDVDAEELDDGVSVEPVAGEPGSVWLHVHVADPTAVLPIEHPLVQHMQKRTESVYFAHQTWSMLPASVTALCDMGRPDVGVNGQNVLTFSAKIGMQGELLDYKVRAGRVRNIYKFRYEDVNEVIGTPVTQYRLTPFERSTTTPPRDISHVLPHANQLKLMYEVSRRIVRNRLTGDSFQFSTNTPDVRFVDKPVLHNPSHSMYPTFYRGFPKLRFVVTNYKYVELGARSLVAEAMKVAGRVCSLFCLENNIPAIRRYLPPLQYSSSAQRERILSSRDELGFVDPVSLIKEGIAFPAGDFTTAPAAHSGIGVAEGEGYVRATSPLRRAEDMFAHWQVKSTLLPGGARPPLDEFALKRMIDDFSSKKHALKKAYRAHTRQWTHTYIMRFMEAQTRMRLQAGTADLEFDPLHGMDAYVVQNPTYNMVRWSHYQDVFIPKLGILAVMVSKNTPGVELASWVKVNAKNIFQYDLNPVLEVELA